MENPQRTAQYLTTMAERRTGLSGALARILPPSARIVLEIGCGHGHFLTAYSQAHPDLICLGLDIVPERIQRAEKKRKRAGLNHLHFLLAEAHLFLDVLPSGVELATIFILFPDPWPKRRHQKHRLLQEDLLTKLGRRAGPDTRLYFRTDYAPYFQEAEAAVREHAAWRLSDEPWPFETATVFQERAPRYDSFVAVHASGPRLGETSVAAQLMD